MSWEACYFYADDVRDGFDVVLDGMDDFQLHQPLGLPVLQIQLEQRTRLGGRSVPREWVNRLLARAPAGKR